MHSRKRPAGPNRRAFPFHQWLKFKKPLLILYFSSLGDCITAWLHPNCTQKPDPAHADKEAHRRFPFPTLAPGEWYDAVLPGLILRVGDKRRTWQFRYHAGGSYHRKPLGHFPAMELAEARDAARRLIERADRGVPIEAPAPHPRSSDVAHARRAARPLRGRCASGKASGSRRCRRRCGCCGGISNPVCRCLPTSSRKADLRDGARRHGRGRHRHRGQPPARLARARCCAGRQKKT